MHREASQPVRWPSIVVASLVVLTPIVAGFGPALGEQPHALDQNGEEQTLLAPLLKLTRVSDQAHAIEDAYDRGRTWAQDELSQPPKLATAVQSVYAALHLETPTGAGTQAVPEDLRAPFATLDSDASAAFTLGALTLVLSVLEEYRHEAPEDPLFVDPLGMIILGGSGDNVYDPQPVGPTDWEGPILVVEPAGNDTYNVPIAAPFVVHRDQLPGPGNILSTQVSSIALEFGGNDRYNNRTASADLGGEFGQALLLDRHGDDKYGDPSIHDTTAKGGPGFAYLLDEEGEDAYHSDGYEDSHFAITDTGGIAYAHRGGTAILWDEQGDDAYIAGNDAHLTHGVANNRQAKALLWDERGNDTYDANFLAYGHSRNDAYARFLDERGNDSYSIFSPGLDFGAHTEELVSVRGDSVLQRGLGEFIDAAGQDTYQWDSIVLDDPRIPENNKTDVDHREDYKWGIFIDCETPADADRPCEDEQREAHCGILRHPGYGPSPVDGILDPLLERGEQACLNQGR